MAAVFACTKHCSRWHVKWQPEAQSLGYGQHVRWLSGIGVVSKSICLRTFICLIKQLQVPSEDQCSDQYITPSSIGNISTHTHRPVQSLIGVAGADMDRLGVSSDVTPAVWRERCIMVVCLCLDWAPGKYQRDLASQRPPLLLLVLECVR